MPDSWLEMKETRGILLGRRQRAHVADACVCSESLQKQHTLTSDAASSPTPLGPPTQRFPHACRWPARGSIFGHSSRDCPGNWLGHKVVLQLHGYCLKAVHLSRCTSCSLCWADHHTYPATFKIDHSCLAYLKSIKSDLASLVSPLICPSGTVRIQCPMSPLLCLI